MMNPALNPARPDKLIKMLNEIAGNNAYMADPEQAAEKIAAHVQRFWARSMKQRIVQYATHDGSGLSELSRMAVARIAESRQAENS